MISPPCRGCKRRNLECHDPEYCPEWGKYQAEKAAFERNLKNMKKDDKITGDYRMEHLRRKENHHG